MLHSINFENKNIFNRICVTENWFKHLQNDVNQIFKSVHQIDVSF